MALTTTRLRQVWAPHCTGPWARVSLHGAGAVTVRASIVDAVRALDGVLRRHNYLTRQADTGAYNCRKITGGTGWSLHAYGIALDINWATNPYGPRLVTDMPSAMVQEIKAIRTNSGAQVWRWGGDYSGNKDAMHYEIVCTPADIASGIKVQESSTEDDMPEPASLITPKDPNHPQYGQWWYAQGLHRFPITSMEEVQVLKYLAAIGGRQLSTTPEGGAIPLDSWMFDRMFYPNCGPGSIQEFMFGNTAYHEYVGWNRGAAAILNANHNAQIAATRELPVPKVEVPPVEVKPVEVEVDTKAIADKVVEGLQGLRLSK